MSERIRKYRDSKNISQSDIKMLIYGPQAYKAKEDLEEKEWTDGLLIGSAVDCILTEGKDVFDKEYQIMNLSQTGVVKDIIIKAAEYYNTAVESNDIVDSIENYILQASRDLDYQRNWKEETLIKKLCVDENIRVCNDIISSKGKVIVNQDQYEIIINVVNSFTTHEHTKDYFNLEEAIDLGSIEVYKQLPIYFTYKDVECKALIDMLIVNNTSRTFKQGSIEIPAWSALPIDIKTTGEYTSNFGTSAKRFRYDIQGAWYTLACDHYLNDFHIMPFTFLVESTKEIGCPLVYVMSEEDLLIGKNGAKITSSKIIVKNEKDPRYSNVSNDWLYYYEVNGYEKGIEDYKWYMYQNNWEYARKIQESEGKIFLNLYKSEESNRKVSI